MRARVGRVGSSVVILISMSPREYEEAHRGASLAYQCFGDYTDNPLARYLIEVLDYLKGIKSCSSA